MDKKKLIVFTVTNDLRFDQRMQRHCRILCNAGFDVMLVGRERSTSPDLEKEEYTQVRLKCRFQKGMFFYLEYNIKLLFFLFRTKADIHVAVDLDTILPNYLVAKIKGRKLVFDAHEYFTEVPELQGREIAKGIWQLVADLCISRTNQAYTVGPVLADLFSTQFGVRFHTVMNVPLKRDVEQLKSIVNTSENTPVILYQGALNEGRGIEALMEAIKGLDVQLWLAGEGDLSSYLRSLSVALGVDQQVKFLGWVKPEALPEITGKAWLGINRLQAKGLSYQYSLANKFFDYIHAHIPQLCADFIEYRAINDKFEVAVLCDCDPIQIRQKILELLNDKELYKLLRNNCGKAAEVYNLQRESNTLISLYHQL